MIDPVVSHTTSVRISGFCLLNYLGSVGQGFRLPPVFLCSDSLCSQSSIVCWTSSDTAPPDFLIDLLEAKCCVPVILLPGLQTVYCRSAGLNAGTPPSPSHHHRQTIGHHGLSLASRTWHSPIRLGTDELGKARLGMTREAEYI